MHKIVITDSDLGGSDIEKSVLGPGYKVDLLQTTDPEEIVNRARDAEVLMIQRTSITEEILDRLPNLKVIIRYGIGVDRVDLDAAGARGILVSGVPDYCTEEVAEHAAMFVIAYGRRVWESLARAKAGEWGKGTISLPLLPTDDPVGVVGFGRTGQALADRLSRAGHPIRIFDPYADRNSDSKHAWVDTLEELAAEVNHLSLHLPLTAETEKIISEPVLLALGSTGHLVNTARGGLVDEKVLLDLLDEDELGHASLDVVSQEPPPPELSQLIQHPRVTVTPHVAYLSTQSLGKLRRQAAQLAKDLLRTSIAGESTRAIFSEEHR